MYDNNNTSKRRNSECIKIIAGSVQSPIVRCTFEDFDNKSSKAKEINVGCWWEIEHERSVEGSEG